MSASLVYQYFPNLTSAQQSQFEQLKSCYEYWNEKINVISRKDIEHLYERHILHSLAIAKFIDFKKGNKILDVGTGGGFPGIPLAILFPDAQFTLTDSIGKKITVVEAIANDLGLENIIPLNGRAESVKGKFNFVVSRAVARTKVLHQWTQQLIYRNQDTKTSNGLILIKGGDLDEELKEFGKPYTMISIQDYFDLPFFETKKLIFIPV